MISVSGYSYILEKLYERRVRFITINISETFPIVDHQLSSATMCVGVMISGSFYTPPKLVVIRRTIAINGSALPLWKETGNKNKQQPLSIVPLSAIFCIENDVWGVKLWW